MKIKSMLIAAAAVALISGSVVGVGAQDEEPTVRASAYSTGTAGDIPETIDPVQIPAPAGHLQLRGLRFIDIPVDFTDDRISGRLTISSNGAGRTFADGFARIEPRTYRIDNGGGSWSGSGERVLAVTVQEARPLINHESMVMFGDGLYDGLVAYVFIELANGAPELEAVILEVEMAPLPDPIAAKNREDVTAPRGPAAEPIALTTNRADPIRD